VADTFTPDIGQHVDSEGRVTYDFDGHVHARGLELDASTLFDAPGDRQVRWLRTSDGAPVADIYGIAVGPATGLMLEAPNAPGAALPGVIVQAGTAIDAGATLINADGTSSFVRGGAGMLKLRLHGIYEIDSGPLALGDTSQADLFHNLGKLAYPQLAPRDGTFGYDIDWTYANLDLNTTRFYFARHNATGGGDARQVLTGFLATVS
jgi:hypothetical protein